MKKTIPLVAILVLLICSAAFSQKAFLGGFGNMAILNPTTYAVTNTICCDDLVYVTQANDGSMLYTANWNAKINYIDPVSESIVDSMDLTVYDITTADFTTELFAAATSNISIYIIDPVSKTFDSVALNLPYMLTKRPGTKEVWITNDNQYSVLDYASGYNITSYTFATGGTFYRDEVRFSPDGNTALLTHGFGGKVYKIDANTKSILDSITTGSPFGVEFNADGTEFYMSSISQKIYVYNTSTLVLLDSVTTPHIPFTMYLTPDSTELWAMYHNEDSMGVFEASTLTPVTIIAVSPSPYYLEFYDGTATGMQEEATAEVTISPNPSPGLVTVRTTQLSMNPNVEVFNIQGKKVFSASLGNSTDVYETQLDLSGLADGMYVLRLDGRNKRIVKTK